MGKRSMGRARHDRRSGFVTTRPRPVAATAHREGSGNQHQHHQGIERDVTCARQAEISN